MADTCDQKVAVRDIILLDLWANMVSKGLCFGSNLKEAFTHNIHLNILKDCTFFFSSASVSSWRQIFPTCEMPQKSSQLVIKDVDDVDAVFVVVVIFFAIVIAFDIVVVIVVDN